MWNTLNKIILLTNEPPTIQITWDLITYLPANYPRHCLVWPDAYGDYMWGRSSDTHQMSNCTSVERMGVESPWKCPCSHQKEASMKNSFILSHTIKQLGLSTENSRVTLGMPLIFYIELLLYVAKLWNCVDMIFIFAASNWCKIIKVAGRLSDPPLFFCFSTKIWIFELQRLPFLFNKILIPMM